MFICLGCLTVMVIMSWGCLYLRCCLCGWLSLPPDVTIKSSLRLKFIVWQPVCNLHFPSFHGTKTFILRHFGNNPDNSESFKRVSFKEHSIKTRHNVSMCFALILSPSHFFSKWVTRNPCGHCWGCIRRFRLRLILSLCFRQYGGMEWITSH